MVRLLRSSIPRSAAGGLVLLSAAILGCGSDAKSPLAGLPASIEVIPAAATVRVGENFTLTAVPKDARGLTVTGHTVTWSTQTPSIVAVGATTGVITGVAIGPGIVVASTAGVSRQVNVTVAEAAPASVTVTLASATIIVGRTTQATGTPRDAQGNPVTDRVLTWSSSAPSVATVDASTGVVTAVSAGTAAIRASVIGFPGATGQATATVQGAFAIAFANNPTSSGYQPPGVNTSGGTTVVTRNGLGLYTLVFNGLGIQGGVGNNFAGFVNATASGPNSSLASPTAVCQGMGMQVTHPLTYLVRCEDPVTGATKDAAFRVLIVGNGSLAVPNAFTHHGNLAATGAYAPQVLFRFNAPSVAMQVIPGQFQGTGHQLGISFGDPAAVAVSIYDPTPLVRCSVQGWPSASNVVVDCFGTTNQTRANVQHSLLVASNGRPGAHAGHAFVSGDGVLQGGFSFTTGSSISVTSTGVGRYTVVFNGIDASTRESAILISPQAIPKGGTSGIALQGVACHHFVLINNPLTVDVACFGLQSAGASPAYFGLLVLQ